MYGEDYTTEWVAADYKTSAYKWDMEDGTSMVFMLDPYRRIEKDRAVLIMTYTDDITEMETLEEDN